MDCRWKMWIDRGNVLVGIRLPNDKSGDMVETVVDRSRIEQYRALR